MISIYHILYIYMDMHEVYTNISICTVYVQCTIYLGTYYTVHSGYVSQIYVVISRLEVRRTTVDDVDDTVDDPRGGKIHDQTIIK